MANRFGGIPVDGAQPTNRFGGIPVAADTPPVSEPEPTVTEPIEEDSWMEMLMGGSEVGLGIISSTAGAITSGVAGLGATALADEEEDAFKEGADVQAAVQEAMTYEPRSEIGQRYMGNVGEFMAPVGEAFGAVESGLGNAVLDATGSPELAAIAHTLPTAVLEALGIGATKRVAQGMAKFADRRFSRSISSFLAPSSPEPSPSNATDSASITYSPSESIASMSSDLPLPAPFT